MDNPRTEGRYLTDECLPTPLDTSQLGPIKIEPNKQPHDRLSLLEYVNRLNMRAATSNTGKTYWTVTVLYNTVVYEADQDGVASIHECFSGVLK